MKTLTLFRISEVVASTFSVLFSLSLIKELRETGSEWYVFLTAALFLSLFVIFIEVMKVRELKKKFSGNTYSLSFLIFTFTISLGLSILGVWLWTDKTQQILDQSIQIKQENVNGILATYSAKIDSIQGVSITTQPQYIDLKKSQHRYQYTRVDSSLQQLYKQKAAEITETLNTLMVEFEKRKQENISILRNDMNIKISQTDESFNNSKSKMGKSNAISWIFFIIVGITEFVIVVIQKEQKNPQINIVDKEAKIMVSTVNYLLIRHQDRVFDINDFKYSPFISGIESWDIVKKLYNLLSEIGVCSISGNICRLNDNPVSTIKEYYKILKSLY